MKALNKDIETYSLEIETLTSTINKLTAELESQQRVYDEAMQINRTKSQDDETETLVRELAELNTKIAQFDEFKKALMKELRDTDDKKSVITNDIAKLNNKIYQE